MTDAGNNKVFDLTTPVSDTDCFATPKNKTNFLTNKRN